MDMYDVKKTKSPAISAIRFLAMLSIIACHFCQYFDNEWAWWLNVGVQIFFILSGYLYGNKEISEPIGWLKRQFLKILIPYYIFLIPTIFIYNIVSPESLNMVSLVGSLFAVGTIKGIGHLWFVSSILFCYLVTPYLVSIRNYILYKSLVKQFILLLFLLVIILVVGAFTKSFYPGNISCYIVGFFIAVYIKKYGLGLIQHMTIVSFILCLLSNSIYVYIRYIKKMDIHGIGYVTSYSHLFLALFIVLFLMILFKNIQNYSILNWSDKYSYEIYLVHQLFILSPLTLLTLTNSVVINIFVTVVFIFLFGYILGVVNGCVKDKMTKSGVL